MNMKGKGNPQTPNQKGHTQMTIQFPTDSPFAALIPQYDTIVTQIKDIDTLLAGLAGTHAARKSAALEGLYAKELADLGVDTLDKVSSDADLSDKPALAFHRAGLVLEAAKSAHEDSKVALDEAVNAALRADKSANTTERDTHLATRDSLVTAATSMATLITGATKPITASDLGISKPKGSGSSGGGTRVKSGKGVFSYRRDGQAEFTVPNDHQQSLSSIAFRVFNRAPVSDLRNALTASNGDVAVDETKAWESTVTLRDVTATIRFEVTDTQEDGTSAIENAIEAADLNLEG